MAVVVVIFVLEKIKFDEMGRPLGIEPKSRDPQSPILTIIRWPPILWVKSGLF